MGELEGALREQLELCFWAWLSGLGWSGYSAGAYFGLCLSDAAGKLDTSVSLIYRASPSATAVWVKMCLPLLLQRNGLYLLCFLMLS